MTSQAVRRRRAAVPITKSKAPVIAVLAVFALLTAIPITAAIFALRTSSSINEEYAISRETVASFCAASGCRVSQFSYNTQNVTGKPDKRVLVFNPDRCYTFTLKQGYRLSEYTGARRILENGETVHDVCGFTLIIGIGR